MCLYLFCTTWLNKFEMKNNNNSYAWHRVKINAFMGIANPCNKYVAAPVLQATQGIKPLCECSLCRVIGGTGSRI